jgi:nitrogen fixation protein NifQ
VLAAIRHLDESIGRDAAATYRALTGHEPIRASIETDDAFDRHVFASLIAVAAGEGGDLGERAGLGQDALAALLQRWFPAARGLPAASAGCASEDEVVMVRDLLMGQRSTAGPDGAWLAAMLARRAVEPNHLWEDLGLRNRAELSRLMGRHFAPLAARNIHNMRWKRFFYRMLCEAEGFTLCTTPVCTQCNDFELCFGEETGESHLARNRLAGARS